MSDEKVYTVKQMHRLQRRAFMKGWKYARREQVRASGDALARYPTVHDALKAEYPETRTTEML